MYNFDTLFKKTQSFISFFFWDPMLKIFGDVFKIGG